MINRIEAGYNEIIKWKHRFDKLFSSDVTNGRAVKLEQLALYERLLRQHKRLNRDERMFSKLVGQEKKNLERSLYPNSLVRLVRKAIIFSASILRQSARVFAGTRQYQSRILSEVNSAGFSELASQVQKRLAQGEPSFKLEQSESLNEKERLHYSLIASPNDKGVTSITGFEVRQIKENGQVSKFRFDASSGISKQQAREMISGRAINTEGNNWKMIDFNDKDANGNFRLHEINIPDFDLSVALDKIGLRRSTEANRQQLINGLRAGKKMACSVLIDGKSRSVEIEVHPLKRSFQLFEDDKKISLDNLKGKEQNTKSQLQIMKVASPKLGVRSKVR